MVHMTSQDLEESDCGLIEVQSQNLPGWIEKKHTKKGLLQNSRSHDPN